jgi:GDSL-like Lipase/Acylhydrolase family
MFMFLKNVPALCVGLSLAVVVTVVVWRTVSADSSVSPWLATTLPTLVKDYDLVAGETFPTTVAGLGNRDCTDTTVVTRPARLLQSQQTTTNCFVSTGFGLADSNGLIRFSGANLAGQSTNFGSYMTGFVAIPGSASVLNYTSAGANGLYLHVTRGLPGPLSIDTTAINGSVSYRFTQAANASLRDRSGVLLPTQTDSLSFSTNGKWMVIDSPNRAMLRVNLDTMEALPFAPPFNYSLGIVPAAQTAVSNDGRYALVASRNFGVFKLYDLSTCLTVPNAISSPVSCQFRDLWPFMQGRVQNFLGVFNLRFTSNHIVSLYGLANPSGVNTRTRYSLIAPGTSYETLSYLGMGDSFASGEGDNQGGIFYEPGTDENNNKCHLSRRSYPYLLSRGMSLGSFHSIACSGAVIDVITQRTQNDETTADTFLGSWIPGYQPQVKYISPVSTPSFLTLSVGGNDVGFANVIAECATSHYKIPMPNTCRYAASALERGNIAKIIADQYPRLVETYRQLVAATNKKTRIYIVGYPKFIKGSGGSCGLNVRLNDEERQLVERGVEYMNQVIKAATATAGVYYLDIENVLEGKNLCSIVADKEMAVNGLTEGDDKRLPWWAAYVVDGVTGVAGLGSLGIGNESYHPNHNGHRLMYDKILNLTGGDPTSFAVCPTVTIKICPLNGVQVPLPDQSFFGIDAYNYANRFNSTPTAAPTPPPVPVKLVNRESPAGGSRQVNIKLGYLLPGSLATVRISGSSPLVQQQVLGSGVLEASISIPPDIAAGLHRLEITVKNIAGEANTYYETVFVPGPEGDINDNGLADNTESCGFAPASGLDTDTDSIDDACDGSLVPNLPVLKLEVRSLKAR